jgi:hypothetical protein
MTHEALIEHRELQYLRAEATSKPRRRISKIELRRRRAHAGLRRRKLDAAMKLAPNEQGGTRRWPKP